MGDNTQEVGVAGVIVRTRVRLYAVGVRLRTEEYMSDFPIFFTGHCDSEFVLEKTSTFKSGQI